MTIDRAYLYPSIESETLPCVTHLISITCTKCNKLVQAAGSFRMGRSICKKTQTAWQLHAFLGWYLLVF